MTKRIKTYEDLLEEERRLTREIEASKIAIRQDIAGLKEGMNPLKRGAKMVRSLFTRDDNGPLLNFGLNFSMDILLRRILLGRAGWLTKVVVPYVIKNYASHLITEDQRQSVTRTVSKFISKFLTKKKKAPFESSPAPGATAGTV